MNHMNQLTHNTSNERNIGRGGAYLSTRLGTFQGVTA